MTKLFSKPEVLEESTILPRLSDRQTRDKKRIEERVGSFIASGHSGIIAVVGAFGSGKTATINQLREDRSTDKARKNSDYLWHEFNVWRYSDRQQIWDGLIVEIGTAVNKQSILHSSLDQTLVNETSVASALEGEGAVAQSIRNHPLYWALVVGTIWLAITVALWIILAPRMDGASLLSKAVLKYSIGILFVLLAFFGLSSIVPNGRPLKRLFEFEHKLLKTLNTLEKPLVVVVEDVDRAGEEGVIFMETLHEFIRKAAAHDLPMPLVVLAPQSRIYFDITNENTLQGFERGVKIYDSILYYSGSVLHTADVLQMLDDAGLQDKYRPEFVDTVKQLIDQYRVARGTRLSIRVVKFIFREVNEFLKAYPSANPALAFTLILARYVRVFSDKEHIPAIMLLSAKGDYWTELPVDSGLAPFLQNLCRLAGSGPNRRVTLNFAEIQSEISCETTATTTSLTLDSKYQILMEN